MPDARRSPILDTLLNALPTAARTWVQAAVHAPAGFCALFAALALLHCGPGIKVAGGTSEVGNPANATLLDDSEDEDTASTTVGVRFDLIGSPISIIKEKKAEKPASTSDSAPASASVSIPAAASLSDSVTDTLTDIRTKSLSDTLSPNPAD